MLFFSLTLGLLLQQPTIRLDLETDWVTFQNQGRVFVAMSEPFDAQASFSWRASNGQTGSGNTFLLTHASTGVVDVTVEGRAGDGSPLVPTTRRIYYTSPFAFFTTPVVRAVTSSAESIHPGQEVELSLSFIDPDFNPPHRIYWSWLQGGRMVRLEGPVIRLSSERRDELKVGVVVEDDDRLYALGTISLHVLEGNLPPSGRILAGPEQSLVRLGQQVTFAARGEDPEGDVPLRYHWQIIHGSQVIQAEGSELRHTFTQAGYGIIQLTVHDSGGRADPSPVSFPITVSTPGEEPILYNSITAPSALGTPLHLDESLFLSALSYAGNAALEGFFTVTAVDRPESTLRLEGNHSGRLFFEQEGLYQVLFDVEVEGVARQESSAYRRLIPVQTRHHDGRPSVRFEPWTPLYVAEGSELMLEPLAEDPEGQPVELFWSSNGLYLGRGPKWTLRASLNAEERAAGYAWRSIWVHARDAGGNWAETIAGRVVYIYTTVRPPIAKIRGFENNGTEYRPLGSTLQFQAELSNPDQVAFQPYWSVMNYRDSSQVMTSSSLDPPPVLFDKAGIFLAQLVLSPPEQNGGYAVMENGNVYFLIYDPAKKPEPHIAQPESEHLVLEQGTTHRFVGEVNEPNHYPSTYAYQVHKPITNRLIWTVQRPDMSRESFADREEFSYTFQQPGSYQVELNSLNSVGLSSATPSLRTVQVVASAPDSLEPNDTREQAAPLNFGFLGQLTLSAQDPVDWYRFPLEGTSSAVEMEFDLRQAASAIELSLFYGPRQIASQILPAGALTPVRYLGASAGDYYLRLALLPGKASGGLSFGVGVTTLQPRLIFPYPKEGDLDRTWLSVVNPYDQQTELVFEARDDVGGLLLEKKAQLPGRGRLEQMVSDLFIGVQSSAVSWVRVRSSLSVHGLSYTVARDLATGVAEPASIGTLDELVVPHIAQATHQWYTHAAVVNNSGDSGSALFETLGGNYPVHQVEPPYSRSLIDFLSFLGGQLPAGSEWGRFSHTQAQPVMAGMEIFGKTDGSLQAAGLNLTSLKVRNPNHFYVDRDLYFPHVAKDTANFWTGIAFVNTGEEEAQIRLLAYDDDGTLLGQAEDRLAPLAKRVGLAQQFFPELSSQAGISWIELKTTGAVLGYELFGSNDGSNRRLAGLQAVTGASKRLIFAKLLLDPGRYFTGIAVLNLDRTATANLIYKAYDDGGQLLATGSRSLGPGRKDVSLADQIFQPLPLGASWMMVESDCPLAGFALFGDLAGNFLSGSLAE